MGTDISASCTLDPDNASVWIRQRLGFHPVDVRVLSGGVSGTVLLAKAHDGRQIVIKQALPKLRVEAEWLCDPKRTLRESAALTALAGRLPAGSIPEVLAEDSEACAFAMTAAHAQMQPWKSRLLSGRCEADVARRTGELLTAQILRTCGSRDMRRQFGDTAIFDQLRLDAYYRAIGHRHPDLAHYCDVLIADCVARAFCLVHGDFSPKNILTDGEEVMIIDWECVHYGNPAFDVAFLLNHLLLKSVFRPNDSQALARCAEAFWTALEVVPEFGRIVASTMRHLPALLIARMDGKSPVEYITDAEQKTHVRRVARTLIDRPARHAVELFERMHR